MPHKSTKKKGGSRNLKVGTTAPSSVPPRGGEDRSRSTIDTAMLATTSEIGDKGEMKKAPRGGFGQALHAEELHVNNDTRDEPSVSNHYDPNLAGLLARVCVLEEKDALHEKRHASHESEIAELGDKLLTLTVSAQEYRLARSRFLSTFKRDKLNIESDLDTKILQEGNVVACGGDALVDAALYKSGVRRDPSVFENLYGLDPLRVLEIKRKTTIAVLNTHATVVSSRSKVGSENFYESFVEFIELLRAAHYNESYLDDRKLGSLRCAYWSFLRCAKDEVSSVEGD